MLRNKRRQRSALSYRIPLWGVVLIVGALVYLDNSPFLLAPSHSESGGDQQTRTATADVVVVLDYETIATSGETFRARDFSAAWIDLLEQHLGPVTAVTPASLAPKHLEAARAVVLTSSVSDGIPESLRTRLREFALDGHLLVLERPDGPMREMFSADGEAGIQIGRNFTFARGIDDPFRKELTSMPIETEYVGSTSPKKNADTLLAIDGAPVVYRAPVGDGDVVTIDFDLGELLVAHQQGRPSERFTVDPEGSGSNELPPRTDDLIADDSLRGAEIPYADLLERFVAYGVIQRYAPLPALWPFPGDSLGVVIPIHPDRRLGDGGGWMLEYESQHDGTSTLLSSSDSGLTAAGAAVIDRRGGELGLLWRMAGTPSQQTRSYGPWGFEPVAQPLSLEQQISSLTDTIPAGFIHTTKTAGRWWTREWAQPFRVLESQGVPLDVSYEPETDGFAFGTGFPFRALDRTGLPLGVRELPIVVPDRRSTELAIESLLETSRRGHHQVLSYALAPSAFGRYPDMKRFDAWVESFKAIRRNGHILRNASQFHQFWRARADSSLTSRVIEEATLPDADGIERPEEEGDEETSATDEEPTGLLLRITADLARNDLAITVPAEIGDRTFYQARRRASRVGGELVARKMTTDTKSIVGFDFRRIPVDAGSTRIDVYYK